jgi:hypothetical protein
MNRPKAAGTTTITPPHNKLQRKLASEGVIFFYPVYLVLKIYFVTNFKSFLPKTTIHLKIKEIEQFFPIEFRLPLQ